MTDVLPLIFWQRATCEVKFLLFGKMTCPGLAGLQMES